MTDAFGDLTFVCPRCRGPLNRAAADFTCASCAVTYPVLAGIPDFRIAPDPWIDLVADREKGLRLERETVGRNFESMVRAYWAMTPQTPQASAERFIAHVLGAEARSGEWLATIGAMDEPGESRRWLDVGCGTADLAAAVGRRAEVVGIDVAFRWLVVARRRLEERQLPAQLVCCNAEALPFADATFGRALSLGTLEHCRDLDLVLREARRVLVPGGSLNLRTVNRYSALPEPHVGVLGVGWMPRRWADPYVRWRNGERYLHHWPRGAGELRRAMRRTGFGRVHVDAAPMLGVEVERLSPVLRRVVPAYGRLRRAPLSRAVCRWLAPLLEVNGVVQRNGSP
jgi:SAM-dependent methyltransferase